jgi:hypothetical protein
MADQPDVAIEKIKQYVADGREDIAMAYALGAINITAELASTLAEHRRASARIQEIFRAVFPLVPAA